MSSCLFALLLDSEVAERRGEGAEAEVCCGAEQIDLNGTLFELLDGLVVI